MCIIHHWSKVAEKAITSAFQSRHISAHPAITVSEAPIAPLTRPATTRRNVSKTTISENADSRRTSTSSRPPICHMEMTRGDMYEALDALSSAIPHTEYAIIGGVACILLGSTRETEDIDIVVRDGQAGSIAEMLTQSPKFGTEKMASGRCRCWFNASSHRSYNVDVLEPHDIGQVFPTGELDIVSVMNRPILAPAQLLNYKIMGWTDRMGTTGYKKVRHARDIVFLAGYIAKKGMRVTREDVYHATEDFLVMFCGSHPDAKQLFEQIGLARRGSSCKSSTKSGRMGWTETARFKQGGLLTP